MSVSQHYGVLRIVRVRPPANVTRELQNKYPTGWLPEERLVHLLTRKETTIGRALNNGIILMDPTVSREHARLLVDEHGWRIFNLTTNNIVRVNGQPVPAGCDSPLHPQDYLVLGSTMLQLIAPQTPIEEESNNGKQGVIEEEVSALEPLSVGSTPLSGSRSSEDCESSGQEAKRQPALVTERDISEQSEPELVAQPWDDEEESLLGAGVTLQFALPQRIGMRTRWLIAGIGITILLISAIFTIVLNSVVGISALEQSGPSTIVAALTIPLIPAIGIGLLVNFIDRFEREPWFLRLAAFCWGAIIAIPPAWFIEQHLDAGIQQMLWLSNNPILHSAFQGFSVGITEEAAKGLGLMLLFLVLRDEFDNVTDGIVYGALIGAGFAMVENFIYFANNSSDFLVFLIVGRIVLGWLCHSTFTVCFGAALGYIRHTRVRWRQIVFPLIGFAVAVGLHSVFDFIDFFANNIVNNAANDPAIGTVSLIAIVGDYIPPFIAQLVLLYFLMKSLAHEAAVIREFLASEVSNGVVRVDEYALLQNSFERTRAERKILRACGFKQWMRIKALYQTEIGLAFRKWHVSMGDKPKLGYRQPEDAYRKRIQSLRQEMLAADLLRQQKQGR